MAAVRTKENAIRVGSTSADGLELYALVYPPSFGGRFAVPDDKPTTWEGVHLGRLLFYETQLSTTNAISCGSCQQQSRAFTDGRRFSLSVSGKPTSRNSMSLANLLWVRPFFWAGRSSSSSGR